MTEYVRVYGQTPSLVPLEQPVDEHEAEVDPHPQYQAAITPVAGNVDLLAGLVTQGLRAASSNPPLNLGAGALTAGAAAFTGLTVSAGSFRADSSGRVAVGGAAVNAARVLNVGGGVAHPGTAATLSGSGSDPLFPATTTTRGDANISTLRTAAAAFTMATGTAYRAFAPQVGAGSTITTANGFEAANQGATGVTNAYGLNVNAQSGAATLNVAARLSGGTTANLWLDSDTASAAGGIVLGASRDTPVYRISANVLNVANASIGALVANNAVFMQTGLTAATQYALAQDNVGNTYVNAASTKTIQFRVNNANTLTLDASGVFFADAKDINFNTATGTKLGTTTAQKWAAHGATPVAQRVGAAQAAVATTAATNVGPWGFSTQAQADAIVTLLNELRAMAVEKGFMKGSA